MFQDASGWTPLMIASSVREGDDVVDLLLNKDADATMKSAFLSQGHPSYPIFHINALPPVI